MLSRFYSGFPEQMTQVASTGQQSTDNVNQVALREAMMRVFSIEQLEILCADIEQDLHNNGRDLEVNLEVIEAGRSKENKILKLIQYLNQNGCLPYLLDAVRKARPHIVF